MEYGMTDDKVEIIKDSTGQYRWHRKSPNGEIVSASGEGFVNKTWAKRSAETYNSDVKYENIVDLTNE